LHYKIYDLWYEATGSIVLGTGFAATRDLVSFLRYQHADRNRTLNPMIANGGPDDAPGAGHALAFGVSQARPLKVRFASDSLLEGDGFELPVPRQRRHPSATAG
jgi:hypothetical protein